MNVAKQFGENLTRARKSADLSQDELAARASVHRTAISQMERGMRVVRIDTLVKLATCVEASPLKLLDGIGWEPHEQKG